MTIRFQFDVVCDKCESVFRGTEDYGIVQCAMARARELAAKSGWIRGVRMGDICPQCQIDEKGHDA